MKMSFTSPCSPSVDRKSQRYRMSPSAVVATGMLGSLPDAPCGPRTPARTSITEPFGEERLQCARCLNAEEAVTEATDRAHGRTRRRADHHGVRVGPRGIDLWRVHVLLDLREVARVPGAAEPLEGVHGKVVLANGLVAAEPSGAERAGLSSLDEP